MSNGKLSSPINHPGIDYLNRLEIWKGAGGFGVSKIAEILRLLGNPQDKVNTFHVAGTNGKGSVSATLAAILGSQGFKTGLNTSPHLHQVNERIVIDGEPISFELLGEFALKIKEVSEQAGIVLSFHEGITALSFLAFFELGVQWNVIEVGLGGRFDASNVISKPVASVITSIDLDHQHILGDTRPQIAREKGGIIKQGCPVIVGPLDTESFEVITELARSHAAPVFAFGRDFSFTPNHDESLPGACDSFTFHFGAKEEFVVQKGIPGRHQFENVSVAVAAARVAGIPVASCQKGARDVYWPGRLEVFNWKSRVVIIDCAHNPHGVAALVDNLKSWDCGEIDIAFGVLDTKNWSAMVEQLRPFSSSWSLLTPDSERALGIEQVADQLSSFGISAKCYGRDFGGFIRDHESSEKVLLVTGSIYLIGELRQYFGIPARKIWTINR